MGSPYRWTKEGAQVSLYLKLEERRLHNGSTQWLNGSKARVGLKGVATQMRIQFNLANQVRK
jgi:hypothetical protein